MKYTVRGFKFERSGLFGNGDNINVYNKEGSKIDEFTLYYDDKEALKGAGGTTYFHMLCNNWYHENKAWELG